MRFWVAEHLVKHRVRKQEHPIISIQQDHSNRHAHGLPPQQDVSRLTTSFRAQSDNRCADLGCGRERTVRVGLSPVIPDALAAIGHICGCQEKLDE
jgi:hypothetical protein